MARERQLLGDGVDSHPDAARFLCGRVARNTKVVSERFVSLASACISSPVRPVASVMTARHSLKAILGEDVDLDEVETAHRNSLRESESALLDDRC